MVPETTKRLILNLAPAVHEVAGEQISARKMARYAAEPPAVLEQPPAGTGPRMGRDRMTATLSGLFLLAGVLLGSFVDADWMVLPAFIAACLLLAPYWADACPAQRLLGFALQEIAFEG